MKIEYNSPVHAKVLDFVTKCFRLSEEAISQRYKAWEKADKMDRSFIDVGETDDQGRKKNPFERQIYIPHSRACKDTIKTYWLNVLAGKRPMIKLHGRGPEDVRPAKLNEIVMDYQAERQRLLLVIDTFINDVIKGGLGSIKDTYGREWAKTYRTNTRMELFPHPHIVREREQQEYIKYEGPFFTNNDPYMYFPDPRYPQSRAGASQFVGFEYERSKYYLQKKQDEGVYYNIDLLKRTAASATGESDSHASRTERNRIRGISAAVGATAGGLDEINPHYTIRELWVEIVPRDLGLDESSYPQEWVFVVADDRVLIRAERNEFAHGGKPEVRAEFDRDGYSLFNLGFYESVEGLQDLLNFMYNSHIDNVRGYLNNMMVVDPAMVEIGDILRPGPRRLIRLKKSLYESGMHIGQVLQQLQMGDVTASHIKDAAMIMDTMQRQAHTPDSLQGVETEIKRTATEIARLSSSGSSHMAMGAMMIYAQAMIPLAEHWLANNQKFLSEERFYRITGDYAKEVQADPRYKGGRGVMVGPDDLQGFFDFPIDDGRMPAQPEENAEVWMKMLEIVSKTPPLQQRIEVFSIFREFAKSMGVKNVDEFQLRANVVPDEQIERMQQRGDIIDINQYLAGRQPEGMPGMGMQGQ
jgi:hypothetical protein